eukprot:7910964-Alexandrium_andersonii.AAC.1
MSQERAASSQTRSPKLASGRSCAVVRTEADSGIDSNAQVGSGSLPEAPLRTILRRRSHRVRLCYR